MITIPIFALRHGQISGAESALYNLMRGLHDIGYGPRLAYSKREFVAAKVLRWIEENDIPVSRYRSFGSDMSARFAEETMFSFLERAERVLFPNYHLPYGRFRIDQSSVIIHDLQHREFPQYFPRKAAWLDHHFSRTLAKADKILFISAFEREQARRYYGSFFEARSEVVYNSVDWTRFEGETSDALIARVREPFVLSVAHEYPHKRLELLIRAFGLMARRQPDATLVLAGNSTPALTRMARSELGDMRDRVLFTGYISDPDLGYLYRRASMLALPSLYEGFGMPAVEALGLGTPALVTEASALPEVTMGHANYLAAKAGPKEWANAMETMLLRPPAISPRQLHDISERFSTTAVAQRVRTALQ